MNKRKTTATDKAPGMPGVFMFEKINYILMLVGVAVITLGFILMSGSEDIFNTTKLTVAPIVVMIGFIIEIVAIMYKPANKA
jgi:hypothetical protein